MSLRVYTKRLSTVVQNIYTTPQGVEASVHSLTISNVSTVISKFNLRHYHASTQTMHLLAINFNIDANSALTWPSPINMRAGDYIEMYSPDNDILTAQLSIYETPVIRNGFVVRGLWNSTYNYEQNDIVEYNGVSYVAVQDHINRVPGTLNAVGFWQIFCVGYGSEQTVYVGESPPAAPTAGKLWWNSASGKLEIYYSDYNSSQWVDASPAMLGRRVYDITFSIPGLLIPGNALMRWYFKENATISNIVVSSSVAPTGDDIVFDINKNGSTIFTNQNNRPTVAIDQYVSFNNVPDITNINAGDYITIDIDTVGTILPGTDAVVRIELE